MLIDELTANFNMDDKEARVYLANLSLGRSKVSEIAKKANLNRITVYEILKRFSARGIAKSFSYKKTLHFDVVDPEQMLSKLKRQLESAHRIIPELALIKKGENNKPRFEYYEGVSGIKTVYEDSLKNDGKIIYNVANVENLVNSLGDDFLKSYIKKRVRLKIKVKVLIPESQFSHKYIKNENIYNSLREYKFFNNKNLSIPNEIMIYDNKVVILSFSSKIAVLIEDEEISKSLKSLWVILWRMLK